MLNAAGSLDPLEPRRHVLVPRRADERIAILGGGQLVRRDAGDRLAGAAGTAAAGTAARIAEAEAVRQRDVAALHRVGELDGDDRGAAAGGQPERPAGGDA